MLRFVLLKPDFDITSSADYVFGGDILIKSAVKFKCEI